MHFFSVCEIACSPGVNRVEDVNGEEAATVTNMISYLNDSQINATVGFRYQMSKHTVTRIQLPASLSLAARKKQMVKKIRSRGKAWK